MPFNVTAKNQILDALDETPAAPSSGIGFVGIHTVTDPGTATNANSGEATGGSPAYARKAVVWGGAAASQKSNSGALTFDVPAGTYGFFTLWNASTGNTNNYLGHIPFGGSLAIKGYASTDTNLANDQFFSVAHGLSDGDRLQVFPVFAESLPTGTGISAGAILFVVSSATNTFKLALTSGGSAIDVTALGGGEFYWQRVVPEIFASQGQITVAISALVLDATGT